MYDNTEIRILKQVYRNPGIHKRELSKQLKISMPSVDYALKKISKLLKMQKAGNQIRYFIDYSKEALTPMLYAVEYSRLEGLPAKARIAIIDFLRELEEKPVIAVIFGSYARGDYTKDSDIDILLVFQKIENAKGIENTANRISMRTITKISPVYLDYASFKESFHNSTKEFYKNLKKGKIILTGIEWWRQMEHEEA
ncbi:MAG: nucleotidyltransferase domain-containing protein [Nanoarchaeota archaeon]|nr:nucleotidyltransferase domain-containing protein [Nanoarchaeota archaeon]